MKKLLAGVALATVLGAASAAGATTYVRYDAYVSATNTFSDAVANPGAPKPVTSTVNWNVQFFTDTDALTQEEFGLGSGLPSSGARINTTDGFHLFYNDNGYIRMQVDFGPDAYSGPLSNLNGPNGTVTVQDYRGAGISSTYSNVVFRGFTTSFSDTGFDFESGSVRVAVTSFVPEPASWAMMIAGFGVIGAALRRRGRVLAAA